MYIGTQPYSGIRARHTYTATAGQTSFSGAGAENVTLTYADELYIDVYQNGVKLSPADYTATSGTTVVLGTGATVSDIIEVIKYDAFSVADTVSAKDGGGFGGNISTSGTLAVTGAITSSAGMTITTADNTDTLTLKSTDADANVGPVLNFTRDSASPANNDFLGELTFQGDNNAGEAHDYIRMFARILNVADGSEQADFIMKDATGNNIVNFAHSEVAFNDDSVDRDFRVESNGNANMLFVDGGENRVGIGTNAPADTLHIKSTGDPSVDIRLILETNGTDGNCAIDFRNSASTFRGGILYDTDDNVLTIKNNSCNSYQE